LDVVVQAFESFATRQVGAASSVALTDLADTAMGGWIAAEDDRLTEFIPSIVGARELSLEIDSIGTPTNPCPGTDGVGFEMRIGR
jgi:hypothetical protein